VTPNEVRGLQVETREWRAEAERRHMAWPPRRRRAVRINSGLSLRVIGEKLDPVTSLHTVSRWERIEMVQTNLRFDAYLQLLEEIEAVV
jgi:hypothetical protein